MRGPTSPASPRRRPRWASAAALLLLVVMAAASAPAQTSRAQEVGDPRRPSPAPAVTDPTPAPGALLAAGTHLVGARMPGTSAGDLRVDVDGERVVARVVDPDGRLSERRGVEVALPPGRHELAVGTREHGTLRSWEVVVSGLAVEVADPDPTQLAVRTSGRRATPRPVVLVNPDHAAASVAGVALAARTDALLLPTEETTLPPGTVTALADVKVAGEEVLVVGGPDVIGEPVLALLRAAGHSPVRVGEGSAAEVADAVYAWLAALPLDRRPAGSDGVVVAADRPVEAALAGAAAAGSTGATLLLVPPTGPLPRTAELLGGATTVLLGDSLSPLARQRVLEALPPGAAVSDDALAPRRAAEAVLLADGTAPSLALLAARGAEPNRAVVVGDEAATTWVAAHRPDRVTLVGPEDAVERLAAVLPRVWVDGPDAPAVEVLVDATDGLEVTFTADGPVESADVHVDLLGFEWRGTTVVRGETVTWVGDPRPRLPESLEPAVVDTPAQVDVTAVIRRGAATRHITATATAVIDPLVSLSREGFWVAGGSSPVVGAGPLRTFSVEVEGSTGLDITAVAAEVERILLDPRGWTADGTRSLQRIGSSTAADLRVVVASPRTVDRFCGAVGLRTGGRVSCWDGFRAMLNLDRWNLGVVPFHTDLQVYREYLVNHEVGHGLGYGHVFCPSPGAVAPVMMQQTGGLGACRGNGWPYPDIGNTVAVPPGEPVPAH